MATSCKATTRHMMLGKSHLFHPRCLQVCSTMYTSGSWAAWAQLKFGIKLGPPSFRKGKCAIFAGVAQSFWRVSCCRTDCTPLQPHQQLALAGAPGPEQCCRGVQACMHTRVCVRVCACTCGAQLGGAAPGLSGGRSPSDGQGRCGAAEAALAPELVHSRRSNRSVKGRRMMREKMKRCQ